MPTPSFTSPHRTGLLAAGNFIIDHVKLIDYYPAEEMLATISAQSSSNGGGPYNVLKALAKLGAPFPLAAAGLLGADAGARWIFDDCAQHGIEVSQLRSSPNHATSYTDAFTVEDTGRRTFFHQPGANAVFAETQVDFANTTARFFYLGYLMLLDHLDALDASGGTGAARLLQRALEAGCVTFTDLVSKNHPDFARSAAAALPYVDYLCLNEVEAGQLVGADLRPGGPWSAEATVAAAQQLLGKGVRQWVIIHAVEGAVAVCASGAVVQQTSLTLPPGFSQGATGAGDAFAAGLIYALHEGEPMAAALQLAVCTAAACLRHPSTSAGIGTRAECLALTER